MRRRFTLTQSSLEEDFAEMKLKDAQKKATELMEVMHVYFSIFSLQVNSRHSLEEISKNA